VLASALVLLTFFGPGVALAAAPSNPFAPGIPQQGQPTVSTPAATPTVVGTSAGSSDSGLSGTDAALIGIGAIVILVGISLFIWRDARRRAPVRAAAAAAGGAGGRAGSKPKPKPRKLSPAERRRRKRGRAR